MNQASALGGTIHIITGTLFGATGVVANSIPDFRTTLIGRGTGRAATSACCPAPLCS